MRVVENNSKYAWVNWLLNQWPFLIDTDSIRTIAWSWGPWGVVREPRDSLYYNGYVFVRLSLPFDVRLHIRTPRLPRYFQCGVGWKLNGRFAITFRFQTDATSARGVNGPNLGQAQAMERGPK